MPAANSSPEDTVAAIPALLRQCPRWVCWRYEERQGKRTKVPYNPGTGRRASSTAADTWSPFQIAWQQRHRYDGPGIVLVDDDDLVGVDLDHCIDEFGTINDWAADIVGALDSYTEITPSGQGLRIFCRGALPPGGRKRGNVEMYDRERFLTVTGNRVADTRGTIEERANQLAVVHSLFFPPEPELQKAVRPLPTLELDDQELLRRAESATNGQKFAALWRGDTSEYGGDDSSADLALCSALTFWTGGDQARIDRLFRQSGLMRAKWDERRGVHTYGERTITHAVATTHNSFSDRRNGHSNFTSNVNNHLVGSEVGKPTSNTVLWCDAADLAAEQGEDELSYLPLLGREGFVVRGWSHLIAGYPRVGKTELVVASIRQWLEVGESVLLFTEEPRSMWRQRLRRLVSWPRGLRLYFGLGIEPSVLLEEMRRAEEANIVVDTIRNLLRFEDENDNSEIARKVNPWVVAGRQHDKTLMLASHMRKGAGENGEGIAGGHALLGAVDIALEVVRDRTLPPNRRKIRSYARLIQPGELLYEMTPADELVALGEPHALARAELERRFLAVIESEWLKTATVVDALDEPKPSLESARQVLTGLARAAALERDPPIEEEKTQGKTLRWRRPGQLTSNGPSLKLEVSFDDLEGAP